MLLMFVYDNGDYFSTKQWSKYVKAMVVIKKLNISSSKTIKLLVLFKMFNKKLHYGNNSTLGISEAIKQYKTT